MPDSRKTSSDCSHSSLLSSTGVLSPLWLLQAILPRPATCWPFGHHTHKPWLTREMHVCAYGYAQWCCGRRFKASQRNVPWCPATPLMKTANTVVWHHFRHKPRTKQGNTASGKCTAPGVEGKCATIWICQKAKAWGKYDGSSYFTSYLSLAMAPKTWVKVCNNSHCPRPHSSHDAESKGIFCRKPSRIAIFLPCHWAAVTAPLQK